MKKILQIIYIVLCMAICLVPFAGMTFWATDSTTENKTLAAFPVFLGDDGLNMDFFDELSEYFEDHFAFREAFVNADALIMGNVFGESNEDSVIYGENGWMYYSATLDDYLGQDLMSNRGILNAVHNLGLAREYVEDSGAQFLVTVAPNKNSLYDENMPYYYSVSVSDESNQEKFSEMLSEEGVSYADLFALFESQDEVLYLKRDSHWNNKGALLVYNTLMDLLEIDHDNYETTPVIRTKSEIGDLAQMIYPLTAEPEWNYYYQSEYGYVYVTDTGSVEDAWIATENSSRNGSLLMFRDSFGNTLLPFFAEAFGEAYFSKGEPYALGRYMDTYEPEVVIIERVERNLSDFAKTPPIMQCPQADEGTAEAVCRAVDESSDALSACTVSCEIGISENDTSYYVISGFADSDSCNEDMQFYICLSCGESEEVFETFYITGSQSDYGYLLYLSEDYIDELAEVGDVDVYVVAVTDGNYEPVYSGAW